jgi:hypothetical protein
MITLNLETSKLIRQEMESIPEKYQKPFNSPHEGLGVLREEYLELENEIFFGEKLAKKSLEGNNFNPSELALETHNLHRDRIRKEAVQVAAMACRIIQELT